MADFKKIIKLKHLKQAIDKERIETNGQHNLNITKKDLIDLIDFNTSLADISNYRHIWDKEICDLYVKKSVHNFQYITYELQTFEMIKKMLEKNEFYQNANLNLFNEELIDYCFKHNQLKDKLFDLIILEQDNEEYKNKVFEIVKKFLMLEDVNYFNRIKSHIGITEDIISFLESGKTNIFLKYIPKDKQTDKIIELSLQQNILNLQYVEPKRITIEEVEKLFYEILISKNIEDTYAFRNVIEKRPDLLHPSFIKELLYSVHIEKLIFIAEVLEPKTISLDNENVLTIIDYFIRNKYTDFSKNILKGYLSKKIIRTVFNDYNQLSKKQFLKIFEEVLEKEEIELLIDEDYYKDFIIRNPENFFLIPKEKQTEELRNLTIAEHGQRDYEIYLEKHIFDIRPGLLIDKNIISILPYIKEEVIQKLYTEIIDKNSDFKYNEIINLIWVRKKLFQYIPEIMFDNPQIIFEIIKQSEDGKEEEYYNSIKNKYFPKNKISKTHIN